MQAGFFVSFIVTEEGNVANIEVAKGVESSLDSAAVAAVSKLKKFKPATINDKPVTYRYIVPINFSFTDQSSPSISNKVPPVGTRKLKLMDVE